MGEGGGADDEVFGAGEEDSVGCPVGDEPEAFGGDVAGEGGEDHGGEGGGDEEGDDEPGGREGVAPPGEEGGGEEHEWGDIEVAASPQEHEEAGEGDSEPLAALEGGPEAEAEEAEEEGQLEASDLGGEVVDAGEEGAAELAEVTERVGGDGLEVLVDEVFVALVGVGEVGALGLGLEEGFFGEAAVGEVGAASEDFGGVEGESEAVIDDFLSGDPWADGEGGAEGVEEADEEGSPPGDAPGDGEGDDDEEVEGKGEEGDAGGEGSEAVDEAGEEGPAGGKDPGGQPGGEQGEQGEHVAAVFGDDGVDVVEVGGGGDGADGEYEAQPAGVEEATDAVDAGDGEGEADGVEALGKREFDAEEGEEGGEEGGVEGALILEAAFESLAFSETDGHGEPSGGITFRDAFDHEGVVGEVAVGVEAGEDGN